MAFQLNKFYTIMEKNKEKKYSMLKIKQICNS